MPSSVCGRQFRLSKNLVRPIVKQLSSNRVQRSISSGVVGVRKRSQAGRSVEFNSILAASGPLPKERPNSGVERDYIRGFLSGKETIFGHDLWPWMTEAVGGHVRHFWGFPPSIASDPPSFLLHAIASSIEPPSLFHSAPVAVANHCTCECKPAMALPWLALIEVSSAAQVSAPNTKLTHQEQAWAVARVCHVFTIAVTSRIRKSSR
jgi:hypothetical protein